MRLTSSCPQCHKNLELQSQDDLGAEWLNYYKCGHSFIVEKPIVKPLNFTSIDGTGKEAYGYQKEGIEFIISSGFNCIIGDQQRLGKTPQSLIALANNYKEMTPTLIIVGGANIYQWLREYKTWVDTLPMGVWVIQGTKSWIPPGFSAYIISKDTFSRPGICDNCGHSGSNHSKGVCTHAPKGKNNKEITKICGCNDFVEKDSMVEKLLTFGFKLCIVDELHHFKNTDSNRSQALVQFIQKISTRIITKQLNIHCVMCGETWEEPTIIELTLRRGFGSGKHHHNTTCKKCGNKIGMACQKDELIKDEKACGLIMLSGTPIKNRADEFFVPLNLVAPDVFPSQAHFEKNYLDYDGKRIKPYMMDSFQKAIKPYFLRREKEDVYKDIPKLNRMFTVIDIDNEKLKKLYNQVLDTIEAKNDFRFFANIGELAQLRQICGLGKVDWTSEYIDTCLEDANGKKPKYAIGVHHHSVRDAFLYKLQRFGTVKLDGTDGPETKDRIAHNYFEKSPEQILILGMQAAKEGIELVYLNDAIVVEREWSSAEEEQFEYRFYNPNQEYLEKRGLFNKRTDIEYILAKGTIDEFFYDLVEEKRRIFGETISKNWSIEQDNGSFKTLMERTLASRL
jgi:SNF2 family DNA or RNA helicase